ncbi:unnamed protein product [Hermetia illucens]|uniref:SAGA-associated factor 11 homolog n=1 Tax=Hermetia illucens TaxID=343691 RepID=A0A7R8USD9_HERIL|nr:SAGA-associated factor 11 homolog [Hermetia illucens]CAD7085208.1 unnamed protein product [Hermetia illucens]
MTESISRTEPSSRHHFEYTSEQELLSEFCKHMSDPKNVDIAANYLYQSLLDESILGVVFEVHHLIKSGMLDALEGEPEDSKEFAIVDLPDLDVFGSTVGKKAIDCTCPNCDRLVSTSRFAPHLEKCMGMGRNSSRIASRRIASSREGSSSFFGSNVSDDEEADADWSGEKRRKKIQQTRPNGSKKNGKS